MTNRASCATSTHRSTESLRAGGMPDRPRREPRTRYAPHGVMAMPRTVTIVMDPDPDRQPTRTVVRTVQAAWSPGACTDGRPRRPIPHRAARGSRGVLSSHQLDDWLG
jgi:hypothetical protein